jgi:hypothetical protein
MRLIVEFYPTDGSDNGGKLFVQTNPHKQVHIVDTSVSKLLVAEGLILANDDVLEAMDGDGISIRTTEEIVVSLAICCH